MSGEHALWKMIDDEWKYRDRRVIQGLLEMMNDLDIVKHDWRMLFNLTDIDRYFERTR